MLEEHHLVGSRLFPSRNELIASLDTARGGRIAEIGVALGDFSALLLETLQPTKFVAFDTFEMDNWPDVWGRPKSEVFKGKTHSEFYRDRFRNRPEVIIEPGDSKSTLQRYRDQSFDLIYIDADHTYEGVKADTEIARKKITADGILMFNDYIMFDHFSHVPYGVVQAVNELIVAEDWRVIGYALNPHLFCDIAIRRV